MIGATKARIVRSIINGIGFHSDTKIIVIESDDWGAQRMPSTGVYAELVRKNVVSNADPFAAFDSLETDEDLNLIFETLLSVKGADGKPAVLTANCIMANPDFTKIKASGYQEYYFESVEDTFRNSSSSQNAFALWNKGINDGVFFPQLHGREHVNVQAWLKRLQRKDEMALTAFEHGVFAVDPTIAAALNHRDDQELQYCTGVITEAASLFFKKFGFHSQTFIAPNYTWSSEIEKTLNSLGIRFLQGSKIQNVPGNNSVSRKYHYTGQRNLYGQKYMVRNCLFEPSIATKIDYVDVCMKHIANAFFWKTPAIIGSHRLNFSGTLNVKQRDKNLRGLHSLLQNITKKYPDTVFMTSADLSNVISNS